MRAPNACSCTTLKHWDENLCFHAETAKLAEYPGLAPARDLTYSSSPVPLPCFESFHGPSRNRSMIGGKNSVARTSSSVKTSASQRLSTRDKRTIHESYVYISHIRDRCFCVSSGFKPNLAPSRSNTVLTPESFSANGTDAGTHVIQSTTHHSASRRRGNTRRTHTLWVNLTTIPIVNHREFSMLAQNMK